MSGAQVAGPTGKAKNCNVWAQWESKGASKTAALCHGGFFEGESYRPCPSRQDCQRETSLKVVPLRIPPRAAPRPEIVFHIKLGSWFEFEWRR